MVATEDRPRQPSEGERIVSSRDNQENAGREAGSPSGKQEGEEKKPGERAGGGDDHIGRTYGKAVKRSAQSGIPQ